MSRPHGPSTPFETCFDAQPAGAALPADFRRIYGAWPLPARAGRPLVYANFVTSRDGRVSFNTPGHMGGGDISRRSEHDQWLMGLLRARADAVLVGATSLAAAGKHVWTAAAIAPADAGAWAALRAHEGRPPTPLQVVITRSGAVTAADAPIFRTPGLRVLLATTIAGAAQARPLLDRHPHVELYAPAATLELPRLLADLARDYEVRTLLCEAGPQVYGSLHAARLVDDEFVTLSPILVGSSADQPRPSLVEGVAFSHVSPPQSQLLSVHRAGDYLFLHSRYPAD